MLDVYAGIIQQVGGCVVNSASGLRLDADTLVGLVGVLAGSVGIVFFPRSSRTASVDVLNPSLGADGLHGCKLADRGVLGDDAGYFSVNGFRGQQITGLRIVGSGQGLQLRGLRNESLDSSLITLADIAEECLAVLGFPAVAGFALGFCLLIQAGQTGFHSFATLFSGLQLGLYGLILCVKLSVGLLELSLDQHIRIFAHVGCSVIQSRKRFLALRDQVFNVLRHITPHMC